MTHKSNISLIGMPGSGKSTVGLKLAAFLGMTFIDTDHLIESTYNATLQHLVNTKGAGYLRRVEEEIISSIDCENSMISTGGSAVFSDRAMQHLTNLGHIAYLSISLPTLLRRVSNVDARGLVKLPSTTLQMLYFQRLPLYKQWASVTIANNLPLSAYQFDLIVGELRKHGVHKPVMRKLENS